MKRLGTIVRLAIVLGSPNYARGIEINGTVRETSGDSAKIALNSEFVPTVGDSVEVYFKMPGVEDEVSVAKGKVAEITGDTVSVKIESATGTVAKDQLAKIISENDTLSGYNRALAQAVALPPRPSGTPSNSARRASF